MSLLANLKTWSIVHVFLGYVFILSGLIINFFMLCTVPIWFISRSVYRRIICFLTFSHWSQLIWLGEQWSNSDVTIYMDPEDYKHVGTEHSLVLMNHSYEVDWLMGWIVVERLGLLGASRVYAKKELRYAPLIGWAWYFAESVFLQRNWDKDQYTIVKQLDALSTYPHNVTLLLFPEGTRFTPEKLETSNQVAEKKGYSTMKHILLPRTRGFVLSMKSARKFMPVVMDCTILFPSSVNNNHPDATLINILKGLPMRASMHLRRIPMSEIPEDDEECARWLIDLYKKKDDIMEEYYKTGKIPGQPLPLKSRPYALINFTIWSTILGALLLYVFWLVITSAPYYVILILVGVLFGLSFGIQKMVEITEVKNTGSEYGSTKKVQ